MRPQYEEVRAYLREWHNPHNEPGQYDGNGLVHLLLAIVDNLRANEDWANLPATREAMSEDQAAFFLKMAAHVRGEQPIATRWPTLGEAVAFLKRMGFTEQTGKDSIFFIVHPRDEETWFTFRNRDRSALLRPSEATEMRTLLTHRGYVSDREFARFWHQCLDAPPREAFQ